MTAEQRNTKEIKILSPTGILGYGFPPESFKRGLEHEPDCIAVDGGSTDPGPYYLGVGKSFTSRGGVKRDLRFILKAAIGRQDKRIPVIIGSAGGAGAKPHLDWCRDIVKEIALEEGLRFKLACIYADIPARRVRDALAAGKISAGPYVPELTESIIEESVNIVGQMGTEPIIRALEAGADVILAGRAYDPAVFAALPIFRGFDHGLALHMGKILECAAIAADPGSGADCALGTLSHDSFRLEALNPERRFTAASTAAHTLYEKSDPLHLPGPGGSLNLEAAEFLETPDGASEVRGSRFEPASPYRIKLEAARLRGYRTLCVAGVRDPILIASLDGVLNTVKNQVISSLEADGVHGEVYFHVYGRDGVMGPAEDSVKTAHEVGIVMEAVAADQERADELLSAVRSTLLHYGYPGRIATAGNLALPFSPSDVSMGPVYEFSIYHLMEGDPEEFFRPEIIEAGE
jgi:hypothetical protein